MNRTSGHISHSWAFAPITENATGPREHVGKHGADTMTTLISIDPGKRSIAFAIWQHAGLQACGLARNQAKDFAEGIRPMVQEVADELMMIPDHVVVELPRIYPTDRGKRPNDLIDLATVAGACTILGQAEFVHPHQWKGQLPKSICTARTEATLNERELLLVTTRDHNVMDAIGIGLWWLRKRGMR